jgi:hypothetical protein
MTDNLAPALAYVLVRDVTTTECHWLADTITKDTVVYRYKGATYGCISWAGFPATLSADGAGPFFELPRTALTPEMQVAL